MRILTACVLVRSCCWLRKATELSTYSLRRARYGQVALKPYLNLSALLLVRVHHLLNLVMPSTHNDIVPRLANVAFLSSGILSSMMVIAVYMSRSNEARLMAMTMRLSRGQMGAHWGSRPKARQQRERISLLSKAA